MTLYFFDTSALLKRYIIEDGRNWVVATLDPANSHLIFIAQVTPVEIISGIAREARILLRRHTQREYKVVNFTNQIGERAQDLLEIHPLRAYDAIQLASVLHLNTTLTTVEESPLIFDSADIRLLTAAGNEGLQTHNPV